jgi:hypothetical protein
MTAAGPCRCSELNCAARWGEGEVQSFGVFRVEEKGAVDTAHGGDGAGLLDWFPLSQGASECRAIGKLARQTGSDALDWRDRINGG